MSLSLIFYRWSPWRTVTRQIVITWHPNYGLVSLGLLKNHPLFDSFNVSETRRLRSGERHCYHCTVMSFGRSIPIIVWWCVKPLPDVFITLIQNINKINYFDISPHGESIFLTDLIFSFGIHRHSVRGFHAGQSILSIYHQWCPMSSNVMMWWPQRKINHSPWRRFWSIKDECFIQSQWICLLIR